MKGKNAMLSKDLQKHLKDEIDHIPVVDTHEHMYFPEEDYVKLKADFGQFLFHYNSDDLQSAGMEIPDLREFRDTAGNVIRVNGMPLSLEEKWKYIKPHWENVKYTGYGRTVQLSLRKLCGIDDLKDDTYQEVSEKLTALMKPGIYRKILKDICNFTYIMNDVDLMVAPGAFERLDRTLFHFVARFRCFTHAHMPAGIEFLEKKFNRTIRSVDHLIDTIDMQFDQWEAEKRVALKTSDAYLRTIHFEDSTRSEAERVLNRVFTLRKIPTYNESLSFEETRPFENFFMHRILERAEERHIPVIIHTGIQAFLHNELINSRAMLLTNLFRKYPKLRFHLLHSSYPWMEEAVCLAKQFPNVSLDLAWVHVIVPQGARTGLSHMLDAVPVNKIHGFGGDYMVPLNIWGALEMARENIAIVLSEKVENGHMTESDAVDIAWKLLNKNAHGIFWLQ